MTPWDMRSYSIKVTSMDSKTMDHAVKALKSDSPGRDRLLQLNNDNARETSHLTAEKFAVMIETARVATVIEPALAFMLAFDQDDDYDGRHFQWFRQHLDRFLYIDRVIVSTTHRRHGLGRLLYEDLIMRAGRLGCRLIACEVNFRLPIRYRMPFMPDSGSSRSAEPPLTMERRVSAI